MIETANAVRFQARELTVARIRFTKKKVILQLNF